MKPYIPQKIFVEKAAAEARLTRKILERLKDIPVDFIEDSGSLMETIRNNPDPIGTGKRYLLLVHDRGRSFKPFPESLPYLSCDYFTLHLAEGCDMECSYCILQSYLTNPLLTVHVNIDEILDNLQNTLNQNCDRFFRIGTGHLADSLSMDHITGFSEVLVPFFARQENAVLELKTKSVNIDGLLNLRPEGRTIVSWSMNSRRIQEEEEHKCASINDRIAAAKRILSAADYRVGFHFDPIIDYPNWIDEYAEVLESIFSQIPEDRIAWISLGCLRLMPRLKPIMQNRFPKTKLPLAEWITSMDGKMRYFKPRRIEIYRQMVEKIRGLAPHVTLYLMMESPEVWHRVFGKEETKASVCELLDRAGKIPAASKL